MNNIENQLTQLRLHGVKSSWKALMETKRQGELSLPEGLEILLQAEIQDRDNRRFDRLRKSAKFRYGASIEELKYDASRGLDKGMVSILATGEYITKGEAVLITGATGCGKSFISSALGHHACSQGYKVTYFNVQKLLQRTKMARLEGTIHQLLQKISKTDLLILDDFGLTHLEKQHQLDLMEIIEDRHAKSATIVVSQLPVANWFDVIGEATIADAILDRLVHTSYRIELKGESLRRKM
ncbi:MAG: IS21-like element helper ATPase IstB [Prolixibacteraceae bacterium]|jgi:DNA replication protein DnaC|nr:IS21-like element helper ATPase IstB [Prolixibacteraceae bacterium]